MDVIFSYSIDRRDSAVVRASDSQRPIYTIEPTTQLPARRRRLKVIQSANALVEKLAAAPPAGLASDRQLLFFTSSRLAQPRDFTDPPPVSGLVRSVIAIKAQHWRIQPGPDPYDVSEFVRAYEGVMTSASSFEDRTENDIWLISQIDFDRQLDAAEVAARYPAAFSRLERTLGGAFFEPFALVRETAPTR